MSTIRPKRATPRRREAPRWTPEEWEQGNRILIHRSGGRCERCTASLVPYKAERHHRQKRTVGGDRICVLLYLCRPCHQWVTEHPADAQRLGMIVATWADPLTVPVKVGTEWRLHDDQGTYQILALPPDAHAHDGANRQNTARPTTTGSDEPDH